MKQILFILGVLVIAFIIYALMSENEGSPPTAPLATPPPATSPAPVPANAPVAPMIPVSTPPKVVQQTPPRATPLPVPQNAPPVANARAVEVERIIRACAKRARWTITDYRATGMGIVRVTGRAPNDNIANQQFLEEIQRSGILRDIENGPARALTDRQGRSILECSFIIKWQ